MAVRSVPESPFSKLNLPSSSQFLQKALPSGVTSDSSFPRVTGWSSLFRHLRLLSSFRPHSTAITVFPGALASCTRALPGLSYRSGSTAPPPTSSCSNIFCSPTLDRTKAKFLLLVFKALSGPIHLARLVSLTPHYQTPYSLGTLPCAFPTVWLCSQKTSLLVEMPHTPICKGSA